MTNFTGEAPRRRRTSTTLFFHSNVVVDKTWGGEVVSQIDNSAGRVFTNIGGANGAISVDTKRSRHCLSKSAVLVARAGSQIPSANNGRGHFTSQDVSFKLQELGRCAFPEIFVIVASGAPRLLKPKVPIRSMCCRKNK